MSEINIFADPLPKPRLTHNVETKGRVWEDTEAKDAAIHDWCTRITEQIGQRWQYARVNQSDFEAPAPGTLAEAIQMLGQGSTLI